MIDLYTSPTPNGHKISCALEAMNLDYNAILVNLMEGEQHKPDFLEISPNGKIPAIKSRYIILGGIFTILVATGLIDNIGSKFISVLF